MAECVAERVAERARTLLRRKQEYERGTRENLSRCSFRQTAFGRIYHESITFCSSGPFYLYPLIVTSNSALSQVHACSVFRDIFNFVLALQCHHAQYNIGPCYHHPM